MYYFAIFLFATVTSANAALMRVTHHSRANCFGFNESTSWYGSHNRIWEVKSLHQKVKDSGIIAHVINMPKQKSHRIAAYHAAEAYQWDNWEVSGFHYMYNFDGSLQSFTHTSAKDCNLSSGWFLNVKNSE